jgi:hypothetical protein
MKNPFDELAKTLAIAKGMPRRDALRLIGGGLAGGVLAAFGVGKALGQGNSPCAHFCVETFPPGAARGKCVSDAAHGTGICFECGPAAPEDHPPLCGQVCCEEGQICQDGTCVNPCPGFTCFGEATICGTGGLDLCFCGSTAEGGTACVNNDFCEAHSACTTSGGCPSGQTCIVNTCCGVGVCLDACDNPGATSAGTNTRSQAGLTALG